MFLGVEISSNLKWKHHTDQLVRKLNKGIFMLSQVAQCVDRKYALNVYYAYVHSFLSYGIEETEEG